LPVRKKEKRKKEKKKEKKGEKNPQDNKVASHQIFGTYSTILAAVNHQ